MKKKKGNKLKIFGCIIVLLICLLAGSVVYYFNGIGATSTKSKEVLVNIPSGSTGTKVLDILDEKGLIKSPLCAKVYLKLNKHQFKSNQYVLNKNMDLEKMLHIIETADSKYVSNTVVTLLDGETVPEFAKKISEKAGIKYDDIINRWNDRTYLKTLIDQYWFLTDDILNNDIYYPLEGYLAPDTYYITTEKDNIDSITKMMLDQTQKNIEKYKNNIESFMISGKTVSIHQFMTLASIVQRESPPNHKDRAKITGVLLNRLNKPMRLQSDVTVNYGNQEVKIDVKVADLNKVTKYNTYKIDGLPVGPISAISTDVINSTLNYSTSDYYFFFSTKDNHVLYAKTYEEHMKNVKENKWY